jgi:excisionase family DNA binding protein
MLTVAQFAQAVGVSRNTVARWVKAGQVVPALRTVGGHARFSPEQVESLKCLDQGLKYRNSLPETVCIKSHGMTRSDVEQNAYRFAQEMMLKRGIVTRRS